MGNEIGFFIILCIACLILYKVVAQAYHGEFRKGRERRSDEDRRLRLNSNKKGPDKRTDIDRRCGVDRRQPSFLFGIW